MRPKNNMLLKYKFLIIILFLITSWSYNINVVYSDQNEATSKLEIAKRYIEDSYKLIKEFETYDVNISEYVSELNNAIEYYEYSKIDFIRDNYTESVLLSDKSILISKQVNEDLYEIIDITLNRNNINFAINISARIIVLIIVGLFMYYIWKFFIIKYNNDIYKMKPKVNDI